MWLLLGGVGVAIIQVLAKRRSFQRLPDVDDGEFLSVYKRGFDGDDAAVIRERKFIAKVLGVPHLKLRPNHRFEELSKLRFDVGYEIGMSDLEDILIELRQRTGIDAPSDLPETVGELIFALVTVRKKLDDEE
jgi:hypothetical protein